MFKKILSVLMVLIMATAFLAITVEADSGSLPTKLFVGEKDKAGHEIITKYLNENYNTGKPLTVYSVNDSKSYYTLDTVRDINGNILEYVLTFYNNYKYSDVVDNSSGSFGIWCDGDLTIKVSGTATFNLNVHPDKGTPVMDAYGIYVKGILTIDEVSPGSTLIANGDMRKASFGSGSVGIYAESLLINDITVIANGGYAGVQVKNTIAVVDAELKANRDSSMFSAELDPKTGKPLPKFTYGVEAGDFIQGAVYKSPAACIVDIGGNVNIGSYIMEDNYSNNENAFTKIFDPQVVVYLKTIGFIPGVGYVPSIGKPVYYVEDKVKLVENKPPECVYISKEYIVIDGKLVDPGVISINDRTATVVTSGEVRVGIYLDCGDTVLCFEKITLHCEYTLFQRIINFIKYYLLFGWLFEKL